MTYLFPYCGMERPPKPPKRPQQTVVKLEPIITAPPPPAMVERPSKVPNMTAAMHKIAVAVCKRHRITMEDLVSVQRNQRVVHARREYVFRCREELNKSFPHISKSIKQDHTTAVYSYYTVLKDPTKMNPYEYKEPQKIVAIDRYRLPDVHKVTLNARQIEVYGYMKQGLDNGQIALVLGRTRRQIQRDTYDIRCKLARMAAQEAHNAQQP